MAEWIARQPKLDYQLITEVGQGGNVKLQWEIVEKDVTDRRTPSRQWESAAWLTPAEWDRLVAWVAYQRADQVAKLRE